jgi:hypothetical protein
MTRHLDILDLPHGRCVGTLHRPTQQTHNIGLLWVNFGYVPRDGHGGLATQASDALAERGILCCRYDLPGLGDAPGPLPAVTHDFFPVVTGGSLTAVTVDLVKAICAREQLQGLVIGGLCGGAVNAIFTGDAAHPLVHGLILLEPEMYLTEPTESDGAIKPIHIRAWVRSQLPAEKGTALELVDRALRIKWPLEDVVKAGVRRVVPRRALNYWGWMRLLTAEGKYSRYVPLPRKAILDLVMGRSGLPSVTNMPLAVAWKRWVETKRPALVITAAGKLREVFFDKIHSGLQLPPLSATYVHVRLSGTNHIFTTGGAIEAVTGHLEKNWGLFSS